MVHGTYEGGLCFVQLTCNLLDVRRSNALPFKGWENVSERERESLLGREREVITVEG